MRWRLTQLQLVGEPGFLDTDFVVVNKCQDFVGVFNINFTTLLGAHQGTDDRAGAIAEGVAGDVVRYGKQGQRMQRDLESGG